MIHVARRRSIGGLQAIALAAVVAIGCLPESGAAPPTTPSTSASTTPSPTPSGPTPIPTFVAPTPTPMPTFLTYTVEPGDSLVGIARRFATTGRSIAYWNRATYPSLDPDSAGYEPNRIEVGWRLAIIPGVEADPENLPEPSAGPTPRPATPVPVRTPAISPQPGAGATVVSSGSRASRKVALTFDMGGRLDPALDIVGWLTENGVPATVFPTGASGSGTSIGRKVLEQAGARADLFELGNHSWGHPSFTELDPAAIADELERTEGAIAAVTGRSTKPWFRPPFGAWDEGVRQAVGDAGWAYLVMWDIDTIDWRPTSDGGPTARDIETKVLSRVQGGSIVLMHLGGWHTLEALPGIVAGLRDRGLEPVMLSELLLD